jgi:hypothetical protein
MTTGVQYNVIRRKDLAAWDEMSHRCARCLVPLFRVQPYHPNPEERVWVLVEQREQDLLLVHSCEMQRLRRWIARHE